jgi:hypothetical protein
VSAGLALATVKAAQLEYSHLQKALALSQKFMEKVNRKEQLNSVYN